MRVAELIAHLQKLPKGAEVFRVDGEYNGSTSPVGRVTYNKKSEWGVTPNTVVLS